jgi:hypothetical protein
MNPKVKQAGPTRKAIRLAALMDIRKKYGCLKAEHVFGEAKSKANPLHCEFEWDKKEGWRQWNLEIARSLVSMFRLEMVDLKTGKSIKVPMFINFHGLPGQKGSQEYHEVTVVQKSKNMMHLAMETGISEISAIVSRWTWHDAIGLLCSKFLGDLQAAKVFAMKAKKHV